MITPRFKIEQTEDLIYITILAPYTNIKKTEIHVLDADVRFYSAPYYLRLTLPGKVEEGENSSAKYHIQTHSFVIILDKAMPGEIFPNLDMLTAMLQPKIGPATISPKPLIEVMSCNEDNEQESLLIDSNEWFVEQTMEDERTPQHLLHRYKYGFAGKHEGLGTKYEVELAEVSEIKDPDSLSPHQRQVLQEEIENEKFSDEHYFTDLMVTDISSVLAYKIDLAAFQKLTDSDRDQLKNLSNQEFLLDKNEQIQVFLGVIDIIFSYLYDLRINEGGSCIESQWNISRLSSSFAFFQVFNHMDDVVRACIRRSLCYPLFRHWDLSMQALMDTHAIVSGGNLPILKCFLTIQKLFRSRDPFYLLNQLYVDEYCVWIQQASVQNWSSLAEALFQSVANLKKESVGFDICHLDIAAKVTLDEAMEEEMSEQISGITISSDSQ